jgi:hypothetical protein
MNDGCDCILRFDRHHIFIPFRNEIITAEYKIVDIMTIRLFNFNKSNILIDSVYIVSTTMRGINLPGNNTFISADRIQAIPHN